MNESEGAASVLAEFLEAKAERLIRDYEWWVNHAAYNGVTNVFFDANASRDEGNVYEVVNTRPRARRAKPINWTGKTMDLLIAKWMKGRPTFDAAPGTTSEKDRLAARAARDLVRHLWLECGLTSKRRPLFLDRGITGNGFVKAYFDPFRGPFVDVKQPCPMCGGRGSLTLPPGNPGPGAAWGAPPPGGPQLPGMAPMQGGGPVGDASAMMPQLGAPAAQPQPQSMPCPGPCRGAGTVTTGERPLGDVAIVHVPTWEIWPRRGVKKVEDGVFHAYPKSREDAAAWAGLTVEEVGKSSLLGEGKSQFAEYVRMNAYRLDEGDDQVYIVERWLPPLPGKRRPRLTVIVGNRMVFPKPDGPDAKQGWGEIKEPVGRIPIFHFRLRPSAEEFWSNGITGDMIAANDFVNRSRAMAHRNHQLFAFPKVAAEIGTVSQNAWNNEEGEFIEHHGINPPKLISPPSMPEWIFRLQQEEKASIPEIAGLSDVDQGKAPPNIEAFQSLHFLAENSEAMHGPVLIEDQEQWQQLMRVSLVFARSNYDPFEERVVRVGGEGTAMEARALAVSDLSGSVDIHCEIGSALAHSLALRQEQVLRAFELGAFAGREKEGLRLMEWGIILGESFDDTRIQESTAAAENEAIERSRGLQQHVILMTAHDHEIHVKCHRRAALEAQIRGDVEMATLLDMAAQQHLMILAPQPGTVAATGPGAGAGGAPPAPPGTSNAPFDSGQPPGNDAPQGVTPPGG